MTEDQSLAYGFNQIHKRFMVLYSKNDMREVWKKVRSEWKKEKKTILPKRFKNQPELWKSLNLWIEERISKFVLEGGVDIHYLNKSDLLARGWDSKLLNRLYPSPDKEVYLGRGRHAYYYNGAKVSELEDTEEFIEYINTKLERKRKREIARQSRQKGFGNEFVK